MNGARGEGEIEATTLETRTTPQEQSGLFEAAFEHAAIGTLFVAPDLRVLRANRAFAAMVGRPRDEVEGQEIISLADPQDRGTFADAFRRLSGAPGSAATVDVRLLCRANVRTWMRIDVTTAPAPVGYVLQFRDMTARRRLEMEHALTVKVFDILDETDDPESAARLILSATRELLGD